MLQLQLQKLSPTGVERLYGFPGVETLALLEACRKAGIEFLLTHHEASAAFMAAADMCNFNVKISLSVNTEPGATNLTTGIAHV